ncbi:MAG TPA: farnesyl diphosphate synthase [bacterium]|nr:farnesyl diphosphate synthase [bacterium]
MKEAQSGLVSLAALRDLASYIVTRGRLVDDALHRFLPPATSHPAIIHEAMRYSVFAGGKHLRPLMVMASAEAYGTPPEDVLPVACAVDLIHTYSLIHDDLPAMDDSGMRRGRPTCHIAFGEAIAVLAGDALHALAFELIAGAAGVFGADRTLAVSREIAGAIGTAGMVGGQVFDLLAEAPARTFPGGTLPPERPLSEVVREIHTRKTAALIRASVRSGAILAGAPPTELDGLTLYGDRLGLAYQIVDDILDVVGEEAKLGKPTGSDAAKATYPAVFGLERSRQIAAELTGEAKDALAPLGPRGEILAALAGYLLTRDV